MPDTVKLHADLAISACKALISCVDELSAHHAMKFGHVDGTNNPAVLRKMAEDDRVRQTTLPVLKELYEALEAQGCSLVSPSDETRG